MILTEKPVKKSIAFYADEIRDVWLNIGKHEADIAEPVIKSWRSREQEASG